jgi:hypothetical protein
MRCKNLLRSARHGRRAFFILTIQFFITKLYTIISL